MTASQSALRESIARTNRELITHANRLDILRSASQGVLRGNRRLRRSLERTEAAVGGLGAASTAAAARQERGAAVAQRLSSAFGSLLRVIGPLVIAFAAIQVAFSLFNRAARDSIRVNRELQAGYRSQIDSINSLVRGINRLSQAERDRRIQSLRQTISEAVISNQELQNQRNEIQSRILRQQTISGRGEVAPVDSTEQLSSVRRFLRSLNLGLPGGGLATATSEIEALREAEDRLTTQIDESNRTIATAISALEALATAARDAGTAVPAVNPADAVNTVRNLIRPLEEAAAARERLSAQEIQRVAAFNQRVAELGAQF